MERNPSLPSIFLGDHTQLPSFQRTKMCDPYRTRVRAQLTNERSTYLRMSASGPSRYVSAHPISHRIVTAASPKLQIVSNSTHSYLTRTIALDLAVKVPLASLTRTLTPTSRIQLRRLTGVELKTVSSLTSMCRVRCLTTQVPNRHCP